MSEPQPNLDQVIKDFTDAEAALTRIHTAAQRAEAAEREAAATQLRADHQERNARAATGALTDSAAALGAAAGELASIARSLRTGADAIAARTANPIARGGDTTKLWAMIAAACAAASLVLALVT